MLHAAEAFRPRPGRHFLRGLQPTVLVPDSPPHSLSLGIGTIRAPPEVGGNATREVGTYNPSIAHAPRGLCPRCAFVATVRVDEMQQCSAGSSAPLSELPKGVVFRSTALVALDTDLRVIAWTWYLACPEVQVTSDSAWSSTGWAVAPGVGGSFRPAWVKSVYDARLLHVAGRLLITSTCRGCEGGMKWAVLQVTGTPTADGGLTEMRAWSTRTIVSRREGRNGPKWAAGRNQALFAVEGDDGAVEVLAQPWLGLVATFGEFHWSAAPIFCEHGASRRFRTSRLLMGGQCSVVSGRWWERREYHRGPRNLLKPHGVGPDLCGPTPLGSSLTVNALFTSKIGLRRPGAAPSRLKGDQVELTVLANDSLSQLHGTGFRLSTTANLVRVRRPGSGAPCEAYLGVGHLHRGDGYLNKVAGYASRSDATASEARQPPGEQPFRFGFAYTHFFYTMSTRPPWRMLATSTEFCVAADGTSAQDCESVQFISSVEVVDGGRTLLLAYGANDCHAKVARLSLERAWRLFRPMMPGGGTCDPETVQVS